jgi:hypothetical protein
MKKLILLTLFTLFTLSSHSQSRTPAYSTSSYRPITDMSYYRALAERKAEVTINNASKLDDRIEGYLKTSQDYLFKKELRVASSYLHKIFNNYETISISSAAWYYKKARKVFNKAIRKHNRRLKKSRRY